MTTVITATKNGVTLARHALGEGKGVGYTIMRPDGDFIERLSGAAILELGRVVPLTGMFLAAGEAPLSTDGAVVMMRSNPYDNSAAGGYAISIGGKTLDGLTESDLKEMVEALRGATNQSTLQHEYAPGQNVQRQRDLLFLACQALLGWVNCTHGASKPSVQALEEAVALAEAAMAQVPEKERMRLANTFIIGNVKDLPSVEPGPWMKKLLEIIPQVTIENPPKI